ncbi:MAG: hypothetical protein AAFV53_05020 [Myxococcota bacterium]
MVPLILMTLTATASPTNFHCSPSVHQPSPDLPLPDLSAAQWDVGSLNIVYGMAPPVENVGFVFHSISWFTDDSEVPVLTTIEQLGQGQLYTYSDMTHVQGPP